MASASFGLVLVWVLLLIVPASPSPTIKEVGGIHLTGLTQVRMLSMAANGLSKAYA